MSTTIVEPAQDTSPTESSAKTPGYLRAMLAVVIADGVSFRKAF